MQASSTATTARYSTIGNAPFTAELEGIDSGGAKEAVQRAIADLLGLVVK